MAMVGISGKIGSGKDTAGTIIQFLNMQDKYGYNDTSFEDIFKMDNHVISYHSDWQIHKFAGAMKRAVADWLGVTEEDLEDREFKNTPLGEEWNCWEVEFKHEHPAGFSEEWDANKLFITEDEAIDWAEDNRLRYSIVERVMTPRLMLQLLGTDAGRQVIHPNIWVNSLFSYYDKRYKNWLITDLRFPNEAKAIKNRGGMLIRINRDPAPIYHSERLEWASNKADTELVEKYGEDLWDGENYKEEYQDEFNTLYDSYFENWTPPKEHLSETALDDWEDWDHVIDNNGTINELGEKLKEIFK